MLLKMDEQLSLLKKSYCIDNVLEV